MRDSKEIHGAKVYQLPNKPDNNGSYKGALLQNEFYEILPRSIVSQVVEYESISNKNFKLNINENFKTK